MSKPISFGFSSKAKPAPNPPTKSATKPSAPKPISLPSTSAGDRKPFGAGSTKPKPPTLRDDSEEEDDAPPKHEALTGFGSSGAILSKPREEKAERVIENAGNGDWRQRGKNILPAEVQAAKRGGAVVTVEKDEVSKAYGLQYAEKKDPALIENTNGDTAMTNATAEPQPERRLTEDERALAALLEDGTGPKSTATIAAQANNAWQRSEADNFRNDVSSRPDSSTLEDYAAMPVEEFGMAMLRGMGRKRRANGEIIDLNKGAEEEKNKNKKPDRAQQGFLGIGAKPVKGLDGVELGAWGKSDMRKNQRGEGFFTPVMIEDKRTGERITEDELERRRKAAGGKPKPAGAEDDWRDRRDRNLGKSGRDRDRREDRANGSEDGHYVNGKSRKRDRGERDRRDGDDSSGSRSRRDRDRDRDRDRPREKDYDSSRSRHNDNNHRSRSRDRRKDDYQDDGRDKERRTGDRERNRDRERDRDDRRYRERR